MLGQQREVDYSSSQNYPASGGQLVFDLLFLNRLKNKYKYGKLVSLELQTNFNVNTGSAGARGNSLYGCVSSVEFKDAAGVRTLCTGHSLLVKNYEEIAGFRGPLNVGTSVTGGTQVHYLDVHPVERQAEMCEEDHGILLSDIGDTASVVVNLIDPAALYTNGPTVTASTSFRLVAEVEECNPGDQFPRTVILDYPVTVSPIATRFNVKGSLYSLVFDSGQSVEDSGTALTEQDFRINDLQYGKGLPISFLNHKYDRRGTVRARDAAGTIQSDDPFARGQCVALWTANRGQKISMLPDLDTIGIENSGTVPTTNSRVIVTSIVDRPAALVAQALQPKGAPAPAGDKVASLYKSHGRIAGSNRSAGSVGRAARRLPIKVAQ